ncbi:membrane protein [Streptomyces albidoflavus]|nr:membrane protein [Streptomyces albidoflavus]
MRGTGGLLLCRAAPDAVAPAAVLLRRPMLLAPAGGGWSVLVPADLSWQGEEEPVDLVLDGWAAALAVGAPWPVLALWWDAGRAGFSLASGVRRPVGYVWLADGTPAGEDEAMRTFAGRLGLDPVFAVEALDALTRPDSEADGAARLRGVLAVLAHAGSRCRPGWCRSARPTRWPRRRGWHPVCGGRTGPAGGRSSGPSWSRRASSGR